MSNNGFNAISNAVAKVKEYTDKKFVTDTAIDTKINNYLSENIDEISNNVKEKIGDTVNSINNPFEKAYWKDSSDGNIYLVTMKNGVLTITKQTNSSDLDDLLEDRLLIWNDEFEGTEINSDYWSATATSWGNEKNDTNGDTVTVSNSLCHITGYPQEEGNITGSWNAGCIIQNNKYTIRRGRIEAKIKINSCAGTNLAFWTNGVGQWAHYGEIDMLETTNSTKFQSALHWSNGSDYGSNTTKTIGSGTFDEEFHIYAVEIEKESISFYQDGNLVWTTDTTINTYYDNINAFSEHI